jgi:nucleoside-diphosphate-sugar epimerase
MSELSVVLGATGGVGRALVDALVATNRRVRAVSRSSSMESSPSVEVVAADVSKPEDARRACAGASVVYYAAQPPYGEWPELFPAMTAAVIDGASAAGAKLVMVDNLYMYGPTSGPLHETTTRKATGRKGTARIALEKQLLEAHRTGRARVTIGRLSDYYGPNGFNSTLSALVLEPALKGKAMRWPGAADQPRTLHFLDDAARGLIVLGDADTADGGIWHLPAAGPITGSSFMALVNDALPAPVKAKCLSATSMKIGRLFSKDAKESVEVMYQWTDPFISDASAFIRAFGTIETTNHPEAVKATVAWMRNHQPSPK